MFRIEPDFEASIIHATVVGATLLAPECQRLFDAVDEAVQLTGIRRVLLEVGADHAIGEPYTDKLRLANRLVNDPTIAHTRFAYVPTRGAEIDPVVEALAKAKGFQGQRFEDPDDALDWLTEADASSTDAGAGRPGSHH
ncbi:MAG: hypothetical protein HOQ02_09625 [Lysobacter sp.]|nr:hypothetical protein [Lysobacter sp.]